MKLIGMLDSPYVRRVAISASAMGIALEHQSLSVLRQVETYRAINPLVKAPTFLCDDGTMLVESGLILDYLEQLATLEKRLMPTDLKQRQQVLHVMGIALVACEKTVQVVYETQLRPEEKQHQPWLDRVGKQLDSAWSILEPHAAAVRPWLLGEQLTQADISLAVAWRFNQFYLPGLTNAQHFPALATFSARAEHHSAFVAWPIDKT